MVGKATLYGNANFRSRFDLIAKRCLAHAERRRAPVSYCRPECADGIAASWNGLD